MAVTVLHNFLVFAELDNFFFLIFWMSLICVCLMFFLWLDQGQGFFWWTNPTEVKCHSQNTHLFCKYKINRSCPGFWNIFLWLHLLNKSKFIIIKWHQQGCHDLFWNFAVVTFPWQYYPFMKENFIIPFSVWVLTQLLKNNWKKYKFIMTVRYNRCYPGWFPSFLCQPSFTLPTFYFKVKRPASHVPSLSCIWSSVGLQNEN